jgi:hypothetical protein
VIIPSTATQLLVALLLLTPGFAFTATRSRLRGPTPADGDIGQRILTSIVAGAALDAVYVIVLGHRVTGIFGTDLEPVTWRDHPRGLALLAIGLLGLAPAALAWLDDLRSRGRLDIPLPGDRRIRLRYTGRYDPTPSAWDFAGPPRGGTFIRVRLADGSWVGGWFGEDSYLSTWPEPHDLFIESQWRLDPDGKFLEKVADNDGVYVSCPQGVVVEWVAAEPDETDDTEDVDPTDDVD